MIQNLNFVKEILKQNNLSFDSLSDSALSDLYSDFINSIMLVERRNYLINNDDYANGFRPKTLQNAAEKIELNVPRTRTNNFRPAILPEPYQRNLSTYKELVYNLIAAGNSLSQIREIIKNMNLSLSEKIIEDFKDELINKINDFKNRQLPKELAVVFIDGKYISVKKDGKVQEAVLYILLGYNMNRKKHILGFYSFTGKETVNQWKKVFNDLLNRGLENVLLFVCDNLSGITSSIKTLFSNPDIQLCLVHIKRNIRKNLDAETAGKIISKIDELKLSNLNSEEAAETFRKYIKDFEKQSRAFIEKLSKDAEFIFAFLGYPQQLHKIISTTNPVESLNNQVEKLSTKYEGYFQSENMLDINLYLLKTKWETKWSKNVSPFIAKFSSFFRGKLFLKTEEIENIG